MKNSNLKHRMDSIPHDFNRDELWNKIENKKKPKRRILWISSMFLMFILFVNFSYLYNQRTNTTVPTKPQSQQKTINQNLTNGLDIRNSIACNTINDSKFSIPELTNNRRTKLNRVNPSISLYNSKTALNKNKEIDTHLTNNLSSNQTTAIAKTTQVNRSLLRVNQLRKTQVKVSSSKSINPIELYIENHIETQGNVNDDNDDDDKTDITPKSKNSIALLLGVGYDNHQFSKNKYGDNRSNYEKELETIHTGFFFERQLFKNLSFSSELSISRSQTILEKIKDESSWHLTKLNTTNKSNKQILYKYYNEYYRIDVSVSVAYCLNLNNQWKLKPSIGLGSNVYNRQEGEIIDMKNQFTHLNDIQEYNQSSRLFVFGSLSLERLLSNKYKIGARISAQSIRFLLDSSKYSHTIKPLYTNIYFGYKI